MKDSKITKNKENIAIAIVGHMGSGKSVMGKLISRKLGLTHVDSDCLIEKITKRTINDIFNEDGEEYFRKIEEKTILSLSKPKNMILSLGGGSIINKKIREFLKKHFITVFINVDIKTLTNRLKRSTKRPLLINADIEKKLIELDIKRKKYYLQSEIILKKIDNTEITLLEFLNKYKKINEKNY